tara:strand:- start:676 stop:810 length:135 start_codon:yes stop_codon:yes gene_type:complete
VRPVAARASPIKRKKVSMARRYHALAGVLRGVAPSPFRERVEKA